MEAELVPNLRFPLKGTHTLESYVACLSWPAVRYNQLRELLVVSLGTENPWVVIISLGAP
jgi:hypothetical protein